MYPVSDTWSSIFGSEEHYFIPKVIVDTINENGVVEEMEFGQDDIVEMSVNMGMFAGDVPGAGSCVSAELNLKMHQPGRTIPTMAKIQPYVMVTDGEEESEWIPQGKFFVDTREATHDDDGMPIISFHAYDAMLKAEGDCPDVGVDWEEETITDIEMVRRIADELDVGIDSRTLDLMVYGYEIGVPIGMSMREVLSNIAGMYGGNWVMNYDGDLLLIGIGEIPVDTNYLVYVNGAPISFGNFSDVPEEEVIILV